MTSLELALLVILVIGVCLPLYGFWALHRGRPGSQPRHGTEGWLAREYGLGWNDRMLVRQAVMQGRTARSPALDPAVLGLARRRPGPGVMSPRSLRWLIWSLRIAGPAYAVAGLVAIIAGTSNGEQVEGVLGMMNGLFMSLNGWFVIPRSQQRSRRNAAEALRLTEARSAPGSAPGGTPGPAAPGSPATAA